MSHQAVSWALQQPVKPSAAKFLLVVLAHNVRASDAPPWRAFASVSALVSATAQDRKTVMTNIERLVAGGWLHDTGERTGGTKLVPIYELREAENGTDFGTVKQSQISLETVPDSAPLNSPNFGTDSGEETVPDFPGNGTVFPGKRSQISHETVPDLVPIRGKEEKQKEKQEEKIKPSRALAHAKPGNLVDPLPDWLPAEAWDRFDRFRTKKSGKGWTDDARTLNLRTLAKLRTEGHDPVAVINQSIERGWTGLFPVRDGATGAPARARMPSRQEQAEQAHQEFLRMTGGGFDPDDGNTIDMEAAHAGQR